MLILARTAQRLYAPLGTNLSLGEYVRLTQRFVDLFAHKRQRIPSTGLTPKIEQKQFDFSTRKDSYAEIPAEIHIPSQEVAEIDTLARDLKVPSPVFRSKDRHTRIYLQRRISRTIEYGLRSISSNDIYTTDS